MKSGKIAALILTMLLAAGTADAAVPGSGVYLNKDGTPVTEDQVTPVKITANPMPPMGSAVLAAMAALPHSSAAMVHFTVNEDGLAKDAVVQTSSGSVVLDEYAVSAVSQWRFQPAKWSDKAVSTEVIVPVRFISTMVAVPAAPTAQPMKEAPQKVRDILAQYPEGLDVPVLVHLSNTGALEDQPEDAPWEGTALSESDQKVLRQYARDSVKSWTFSPARNPDGEAIRTDLTVIVHVQ